MTRGSRPTIASAVESLTKPRSMAASGPALGSASSSATRKQKLSGRVSAFRPGSSWESVAAHAMSELIELGEAREREAYEL